MWLMTDTATWKFSTPSEDRLVGATVWRAGDADGGLATNATYEFWLAGPEETEVFDECVYEFGCQLGLGDPSEPLSSSNRVVMPSPNLGARIYVNASCGGIATYKCPSGKGDPNGYAAVVYLYAADLVLEQTSQPTVSDVEGELATAATLSGTADLSLHAEDSGSGVYEAVFTVDGVNSRLGAARRKRRPLPQRRANHRWAARVPLPAAVSRIAHGRHPVQHDRAQRRHPSSRRHGHRCGRQLHGRA